MKQSQERRGSKLEAKLSGLGLLDRSPVTAPLENRARPRAAARVPSPVVGRAHCELDDWSFDPRYTEGRCPICGRVPADAPAMAAPEWLRVSRQVPWDVVGLFALFLVMLLTAILVGNATGWRLT